MQRYKDTSTVFPYSALRDCVLLIRLLSTWPYSMIAPSPRTTTQGLGHEFHKYRQPTNAIDRRAISSGNIGLRSRISDLTQSDNIFTCETTKIRRLTQR